MAYNSSSGASGGIGFWGLLTGLLTVLFIALKLTGVIDWSWLWVLAPFWGPFAAALAFFVGAFLLLMVIDLAKWLGRRAR